MSRSIPLTTVLLCFLAACTPSSPVAEMEAERPEGTSLPHPARRGVALEAFAQPFQATVSWLGPGPGPECSVCGSPAGQYACSNQDEPWKNGSRYFFDPVSAFRDARVTEVSVTLYGLSFPASIKVDLNGDVIGTLDIPTTTNECGTCNPASSMTVSRSVPGGLPGYAYHGSNVLHLEVSGGPLCIAYAVVNLTVELPQLSVSPGSLSFGNQAVGVPSASQTVTLENVSATTLTLDGAGATAPFKVTDGPPMPRTLQPGERQTLTLVFEPTAKGPATGNLTIGSSSAGSPTTTIPLSGTGIFSLGVNPGALTFASQRVGTSSAAQSVTLSNGSGAPIQLQTVSLSGPFSVSGLNVPQRLDPGASTTVQVTFTPTAAGPSSGTLTLTSDAGNSPHLVSLSGTGIAPVVTLNPGSLAFGSQRVGTTSAPQPVSLTNTGGADLNLASFAISGPFVVSGLTAPQKLAPGASTTVQVTFTPTAAGPSSGTLTLTSDAGNSPHTVSLSGTGVTAVATLNPGSLTFGSQRVGTTSAPQTVSLTNTGGASLDLATFAVTGPFVVTGLATPQTLAPGDSTTFQVAFAPAADGAVTGQLSLTSNASNSPTTLALSGTATTAVLALSSTALSFGNQRVGTTSAGWTVFLSNKGSGPVTLQGVSAPGAFSVQGLTVPQTLAPGANLSFQVLFSPTASGPASEVLTLVSDASNSPHTLKEDGIGTASEVTLAPAVLSFGGQRVGSPSAAQTVVLTNSGTAPLTVSNLVAAGPFSVAGLVTPLMLAPGGKASFQVSFTPTALGKASGSLTLTSDASNPTTVLPLDGTGTTVTLSPSPASLSFGNQRVGTTSASQTVSLTNNGSSPLTLSSVVVSGPYAVVGLTTPLSLPANSSTTLQVTFSPTAAGATSGTLTLLSDATNSPTVLPLDGTGLAPALSLLPTSLSFGEQRVGTSSPLRQVTLSNTGTAPLTLSSTAVFGPFVVSGLATPQTLPAGASITFQVAFNPSGMGSATGTLHLTNDATASPVVLQMDGSGTASLVSLEPVSLGFGDQRVGTSSAARTVTIGNTGTATLNVSSLVAEGPFSVSGLPTPMGIPPGGKATFQVSFKPVAVGTVNNFVTLNSDAADGPHKLPVGGNGTASVVTLDPPTSLSFGTQRAGSSGGGRLVSLTNTGTAELYLSSVTVSGPFVLSGLTTPQRLAQGGSVSFQVAFSPTALGDVSGVLTFTSDASNNPTTLKLDGTGTGSALGLNPTALAFGDVRIGATSGGRQVTLTNSGTDTLDLSSFSVAGPFAVTGLTTPRSLPAGASTSFFVAFNPTAHGAVSGAVTFNGNAFQTPSVQLPLDGRGVGGQLVFSPGAIAFGSTNVGVTSAARDVTLTNTGEVDLAINAVTFSGANASDFSVPAGLLPLVIPATTSASLPLRFTPQAVGSRAARATLLSNDPLRSTVDVDLSGVGTSPLLAVSPTSVSFGDVRVATRSAPLAVTVTNSGSGPLKLNLLSLSGPDAASFSLGPVSPPLTLSPGGSTQLALTFRPEAVRAHAASLELASDDPARPNVSLPLSGGGISPTVRLSTTSLDFGAQLSGWRSRPRTVTLSNTGSASLTVTKLALGGAQAALFRLESPPGLPFTLAPGGSQALDVSFGPTVAAEVKGSLVITSDDPFSPEASAELRGLGVSTVLAVSPTRVDFGTLRAPANAGPKTITLTNMSNDPIMLAPVVMSGSQPDQFPVSLTPRSLAPGESTTATVTYRTDGAVLSSATVGFGTTEPPLATAAEVALSGKAVSRFITVDPMSLDFGRVGMGQEGTAQTVRVTNQATTPLTLGAVVSSDEAFVVDGRELTQPIPAGGTASFTVTFRPKADGDASGQVRLSLQDASTPEVTLEVKGFGWSLAADDMGCGCGSGGGGSALLGVLVLAALRVRRERRSRQVE